VKKADQKKESEENATKGSQTLKFRLLPQGGVGVGVGGLMRCNHVGAYELRSGLVVRVGQSKMQPRRKASAIITTENKALAEEFNLLLSPYRELKHLMERRSRPTRQGLAQL
jgi:hypothetical protein